MARYFKLHPNYAKFSGVLGNVYPVKEGVAVLPDGNQKSPEEPTPLVLNYGGVEFKTEEEARKALAGELEAKAKAAAEAAKKPEVTK